MLALSRAGPATTGSWSLEARFSWYRVHQQRGGELSSARAAVQALATLPPRSLAAFSVRWGHGYRPTIEDQAALERQQVRVLSS